MNHPLARAGKWILILGSGPLLVFILLYWLGFPVSDNPIGLGLLFFFTAPVGVLLLTIGLIIGGSQSEPEQAAPHYRVDQALSAKVMAMQESKLTAEEEIYLDSNSMGACWGLLYFVFLGVPGAFFRHLPANFIYTNTIKHARRQAWEAKSWGSFHEFKQLNDQTDTSATVVLAVCFLILVVLILF